MLRVEFKGQSQAQRQKADTEGQKGVRITGLDHSQSTCFLASSPAERLSVYSVLTFIRTPFVL
jgi:hypothetical protein